MEKQNENSWIRGTNANRQFNLRFNRHESHLTETIIQDWEKKLFFDVTLACEQGSLGAHRIVLCAFSTLFEEMFTSPPSTLQGQPNPIIKRQAYLNPVIYFDGIDLDDLTSLVDFMYRGVLTVNHFRLPGLMRAANILKIKQPEPFSEQASTDFPERNFDSKLDSVENGPSDQNQSTISPEQVTPSSIELSSMEKKVLRKPKDVRSRIVWNKDQMDFMENIFKSGIKYPDLTSCQRYAEKLSEITKSGDENAHLSTNSTTRPEVTYINVRNWFQNKRYQSKFSAKKKRINFNK